MHDAGDGLELFAARRAVTLPRQRGGGPRGGSTPAQPDRQSHKQEGAHWRRMVGCPTWKCEPGAAQLLNPLTSAELISTMKLTVFICPADFPLDTIRRVSCWLDGALYRRNA